MFLVFDVGATHTRVALASQSELGDVIRFDTDSSAAGFARFLGVLEEVSKDHNLSAVAGGIPGQLEGDDGRLALAPNLPDWVGLPVGSRIKRLFGCPVSVLNDVELCGLGEAHRGAGRTHGVMAYFTVSTGVNAVRIIDGKIDDTIDRFEIGKLLIDTVGGKQMTLEQLTGGAAMERRMHEPPRFIRDPAIWKKEAKDLAHGLYDVIIAWNPELVVFGGGMAKDIDLRQVRVELDKYPQVMDKTPQLVKSQMGDLGGLNGALVWLNQAKH